MKVFLAILIVILFILTLFGLVKYEPEINIPFLGNFKPKQSEGAQIYPKEMKLLNLGQYVDVLKVVNNSDIPIYRLAITVSADDGVNLPDVKIEPRDPPKLQVDLVTASIGMETLILDGSDPATGKALKVLTISSIDPHQTLNYQVTAPRAEKLGLSLYFRLDY